MPHIQKAEDVEFSNPYIGIAMSTRNRQDKIASKDRRQEERCESDWDDESMALFVALC